MRTSFLLAIFATQMFAAEIAVSVGTGPATSSVLTPTGTFSGSGSAATILIDGAAKIIGFGPVSLSVDVPVAFGGPSNATVSTTNGSVLAYAEHLQLAVTPGVKARFNLGLVSPWASFGAGVARLEQAGSFASLGAIGLTRANTDWRLALSPAGGIDIKPLPFIFFRGEIRSYVFRTPDQVLNTGISPFRGSWRDNLLFMGGVGIRF